MSVKPKKHLGQHFLKDETVSERIADQMDGFAEVKNVLEIGPGMGALTKYLLKKNAFTTHVVEVDLESVDYLNEHYPELRGRVYSRDFLKEDLTDLMGDEPFAVFGNFPYNISSQILFKVLENKEKVPVVVGMFQKEVAERVATGPGSKAYGIISVLLQAYYDIEYLFTVEPDVFIPPPKVKSGVIKLTRNKVESLGCDEKLFKQVIKMGFNQRRKTLRNSLKQLIQAQGEDFDRTQEIFNLRPEQLSVQDFISLTKQFQV
ncbi:MAG: 16S rRNA (adenine(1518)-N(6)/adenine(1519)-N(6))-dimethyltransferase RsmA [Crocinitomicaceae bacterium]